MATVWYIGRGDRLISAADWLHVNITATDTKWSAENGWAVDQSTLTGPQLSILASDKDFLANQSGPRVAPQQLPYSDEILSAQAYNRTNRMGQRLHLCVHSDEHVEARCASHLVMEVRRQ